MQGLIETHFAAETLTLHPDRAAWWARERTLFIADTHFGKAATFRHAGIPVPETLTGSDVARLDSLVRDFNALRLIILGDFFHAPSGRVSHTEGRIEAWRDANPRLHITLIRGNHDRSAGDPPASWRFECLDPGTRLAPFTLTHTPEEAAALDAPTLCGHVHPAVLLREPSGSGARLPCFFFHNHTLILPAFGRFTGVGTLRPRRSDRVFVIADNEVIPIAAPPHKRPLPKGPPKGYDVPMISEAQPG